MGPCGTHGYKKEIHTGTQEFLQEEDYLDDPVIRGRINVP
jgi:predicted urease superfamily metal-dependent hydrolase